MGLARHMTHRLKMAAQMLEPSKTLVTRLARVRTFARMTTEMPLQVSLPFHRVRAKGALETHGRVRVCSKRGYRVNPGTRRRCSQ